jgi:putative nucleotidyltransferase with HDIG domain
MIFRTERLERLRQKISGLYEEKRSSRSDWADWLCENHVFFVAEEAGKLADRFGANGELATAAGMLHDVAYAVMSRFDVMHEEESDKIAKEFLQSCGFSSDDIRVVVGDAIRFHSCYDGHVPKSLEGKVMATADAVVHLTSNFYEYATQRMKKEKTYEEIRKWALPKVERDFNDKILFKEIREEVRPDYERQKKFFLSEL